MFSADAGSNDLSLCIFPLTAVSILRTLVFRNISGGAESLVNQDLRRCRPPNAARVPTIKSFRTLEDSTEMSDSCVTQTRFHRAGRSWQLIPLALLTACSSWVGCSAKPEEANLQQGESLRQPVVFKSQDQADDELPGLPVGEEAPDFDLKDQTGKSIKLSDMLKEDRVALVFYRSADW